MRPSPTDDALEPPDGHPFEELVALLGGQLGLEEMSAVVRHTRSCPLCQAELVEIVAGAGALRLANRPELAPPSELPPPSFLAEIEAEERLDLGPVPKVVVSRRRRRVAVALAGVAAAVLGIGAAALVTHNGSVHPTQIAFEAVDHSSGRGVAQMQPSGVDKTMTVTTELSPPSGGAYYEVWLLERQTGAMVPLGVLPDTGKAKYVIPAVLVAHYDAVDISLQPDDGSTLHSSTSVLRAYY